jgi:ElaB/YqjD/DUF883 family membrane-anchored ribosome-binding protein
MNDQQLEHKVLKDAAKVKKDISILAGDGASQLSEGFEKLKSDAWETVDGAVETVKKGIGQGLSQYNAKAQEFADQVPGDFSQKAARYPWVAISIALAAGFLLGGLLKPARRPLG